MNRRGFLKGILTGVGATGVATILSVKRGDKIPVAPKFHEAFNELAQIALWIEDGKNEPSPELIRKFFAYSLTLPDNPAALLPTLLIVRNGLVPHGSPKLRAAVLNSPEFVALVEKFGYLLET